MGPTDEEARELLLRSWTLGMSTGDVDDCIALIQGSALRVRRQYA